MKFSKQKKPKFSTSSHLSPGIPYVTDCVMAELEKLGQKYKVALRLLKDPRFERLPCLHKGTYADDCIVQRITQVIIF